MTPENLEIYKKAVTTDRPAEMLARRHGFKNLASLAGALPENAHVLDVGAGASPLGRDVSLLRPDISWTNFDYSYQNPQILEEVSDKAPDNVQHVPGDATKLDEYFQPESFDAVFSYWLLPHLSLNDPAPARSAAQGLFSVTKAGGLLSVGPKTASKGLPALKSGKAVQTIKTLYFTANSYADHITAATTLPTVGRYTQSLANEVATPFFGTSRYAKRAGPLFRVYHPQSEQYVLPFGPKGVITAGRLAIALARYASERRKTK